MAKAKRSRKVKVDSTKLALEASVLNNPQVGKQAPVVDITIPRVPVFIKTEIQFADGGTEKREETFSRSSVRHYN